MSVVFINGPQVESKDMPTFDMLPLSEPKSNSSISVRKNIFMPVGQSTPKPAVFPSGFDHAYASSRSDKATVQLLTKEIQCLKQILTLHLNLIEQQAKKIESKDQELLSLREEHEFLKKKFVDAEKPASLDKSLDCNCDVDLTNVSTQTEVFEDQKKTLPVKRRRHTVSSNENNAVQRKSKHRRAVSENTPRDTNSSASLQPQKTKWNLRSKSDSVQESGMIESILTSSEEYFTSPEYWTEQAREYIKPNAPGSSSWLSDSVDPNIPVQVPSWRVADLSPSRDAEGIEDISDAVYEKRHRKYELEEKRQRRWEEKEFRNQQYREKLKANRLRTARGREEAKNSLITDDSFKTFDPYMIEQIDIVSELPVIAFGNNIPKFNKEEFQLSSDLIAGIAKRKIKSQEIQVEKRLSESEVHTEHNQEEKVNL
uniref:Male-specific lethal 1 homolog n=1 Tax=Cacopsylla melanoneura TaxID=428564 RepID=A0A8D8WW76_9HEMI